MELDANGKIFRQLSQTLIEVFAEVDDVGARNIGD